MRIKKGDLVKILLGKDRGKTGTVDRVVKKDHQVFIPGINVYKRHVSRRLVGQAGGKGEIIDIVKPIDVSNLALVCPNCHQPARVGFKQDGGVKMRFCKRCGKEMR